MFAFDAGKVSYLNTAGVTESAASLMEDHIGDIDQVTGAIIAISRDGEIVMSGAEGIDARHGYASDSGDVTVGLELP